MARVAPLLNREEVPVPFGVVVCFLVVSSASLGLEKLIAVLTVLQAAYFVNNVTAD